MKNSLPGLALALPTLFLALPSAAAAAPDGEWTQYYGGPTNALESKAKLTIDHPEVAWHVADAFGPVTVSGDDLYAGGKGLFHIHAKTGEVLNKLEVPMNGAEPEYYYGGAPVILESSVISSCAGRIEAHSRSLDKVLWSFQIPGAKKKSYMQPGTFYEGMLFFTYGTDLFALNAESGEVEWQLSLGAGLNMVPIAADGHVFVGAASGRFVAINIEEGAEAWAFEGEGQFGHTSPILSDGMIVVGDRGVRGGRRGAIIALDAKSGEKRWETEFGATGLSTPAIHKDSVLAGFGKTVGFFKLKDGKRMSKPNIRCGANAFGSPTVIGKHLVYGHLDGNLYVHEVRSGKLLWQFRVPESQISNFAHVHDHLYLATTVGIVALKDGKGRMKGNVKTWAPPAR